MKTLEELRKAINAVDDELVGLLNRRAELSLAVGKSKGPEEPIFRPGREAALLARLADENPGPLPEAHLRAVYREILSSSRALQRPETCAFLGPEGTFCHTAARGMLGTSTLLEPQNTLAEVFAAVDSGRCAHGVVPLENTLHGSVVQTFDLFLRHDLFILGETRLRVRHSLLGRETDLAAVRLVLSHPQALAQCADRLRELVPQARQEATESTAAGARRAAAEPGTAAVAHADAAAELNLRILAANLEDDGRNHTRFVLIGKHPRQEPGGDRTSLLFSVGDRPGALAEVLGIIAEAGVNLSKLESRPMRGVPWHYIFFTDLDCDLEAPAFACLREGLTRLCPQMHILGAYPAAKLAVEE